MVVIIVAVIVCKFHSSQLESTPHEFTHLVA